MEAYGISCSESLPLSVHVETPAVEAAVALKTNGVVPSSGFATLTIVRKPESGVTTQSEGSDPGPDG